MEKARIESVELLIAKFLRYGVIIAGIIIFIGWMFLIDFHRNAFLDFHVYSHVPLLQTLKTAHAENNVSLIISYFGLAILISLPFIRVLLTAIVFLYEKDYIMAACAIIVIIALCLSLSLGFQI